MVQNRAQISMTKNIRADFNGSKPHTNFGNQKGCARSNALKRCMSFIHVNFGGENVM